jgi:hypothetical protein
VALEYFTLAEIRALPDVTEGSYSDAVIEAAEAFFVSIVEREVGVPFIPRTFVDTLDGNGRAELVLTHDQIRSLTSVTVNGVSVTVGNLTAADGVLRYSTSGGGAGTTWTQGVSNVVVTYSAGEYTTCPADVKNAVMWATRDRLISQGSQNGIDVRRTSITNDLGGTTQFLLPGEKRPTGYPELDAVIASYVRNTVSLGFA